MSTFFDNLEPELLSNILDYGIIDKQGEPPPTHNSDGEEWITSLFFSDNSPFRMASCTRFTEVVMAGYIDTLDVHLWGGGSIFIGEKFMEEEQLLRQVLRVVGLYVTNFYISDDVSRERGPEFVLQVVTLVTEFCPNIMFLNFELSQDKPKTLEACSMLSHTYANQLHNLGWSCPSHLHFPDYASLSSLRHFQLTLEDPSPLLIPFWETCGTTLQVVEITVLTNDIDSILTILDRVQTYCRRLDEFYFVPAGSTIAEVISNKFTQLVASYGAQIKKLRDIKYLTHDNLREIIEKCPNILVQLDTRNDANCEKLRIVSSKLEKYRAEVTDAEHALGIASVIDKCHYLRCLEIKGGSVHWTQVGIPDEAVWNIFSSTLPSVEQLYLRRVNVTPQNMNAIASSLPNLKSVELILSCSIENGDVFAAFLDGSPLLESVRLQEHRKVQNRNDDNAVRVLDELVTVFSGCRRLKEFHIKIRGAAVDECVLRDLFTVFRLRPVEISVQCSDMEREYVLQ